MAALFLVHGLAVAPRAEEGGGSARVAATAEAPFLGTLPANVAEMREAILAAARSGEIEELRTAIEWNELRPDFDEPPGTEPIAYLKRISGDGEGRAVLAVLADILSLAPAKLPIGRDAENSAVYVWPYLAELPLDRLTPSQQVDLYRLVTPDAAKSMRGRKTWAWWRLAIGADGTWHAFKKFD